ncbi:peptidyl-prolyl cis-trans isomerase [Bacteroidota bacterium]
MVLGGRRQVRNLLMVSVLATFAAGCRTEPPDCDFAARVGEACFSEQDLLDALSSIPPGLDSTHAAHQVVDRWITDELLAQEALRRNLQEDPEVHRRLKDNERSVLISALVDRLFDEVEPANQREITSYFERNIDNLRLREPFLRIRYLSTTDSTIAVTAVSELDSIDVSANPDSAWLSTVSNLSDDPYASAGLSSSYFPESRLFRNVPYLQGATGPLRPGQSVIIATGDGVFHVIQLVDRVESGSTPNLEWIVEDIQNRLLIDRRKQMYVDQVQRLRNRALAEGLLEIRE